MLVTDTVSVQTDWYVGFAVITDEAVSANDKQYAEPFGFRYVLIRKIEIGRIAPDIVHAYLIPHLSAHTKQYEKIDCAYCAYLRRQLRCARFYRKSLAEGPSQNNKSITDKFALNSCRSENTCSYLLKRVMSVMLLEGLKYPLKSKSFSPPVT